VVVFEVADDLSGVGRVSWRGSEGGW
jgi:hypothetical protein